MQNTRQNAKFKKDYINFNEYMDNIISPLSFRKVQPF